MNKVEKKYCIGFSGMINGPEFEQLGHMDDFREFRDLLDSQCPEELSPEISSVTFFHLIAGSVYQKKILTHTYRRERRDNYLFVTFGISYEDIQLPRDEFRTVFCDVILNSSSALVEYVIRKKIDFDSELFIKTMVSTCNLFLASKL
jgi:hypothetical protein